MRRILSLGMLFTVSALAAPKFNHNKLIVKFKEGFKANKEMRTLGLELKEELVDGSNIHLVENNSIMNFESQIDYLKTLAEVEYVQKDHLLKRRSPNDPEIGKLWSLFEQDNNADIDTVKAWSAYGTGGSDAQGGEPVVAVVDGGVDLTHDDLKDNVWVNSGEIAGNGKDDDGNGYVDDINGWNAYMDNGNVDSDRHGTHVAGIVGARGDNGKGIVGVNWKTKIMGISLFDFSTSEVLRAYNYVLKQKQLWLETNGAKGANVVATNSSFGVDRADCSSGEYPAWNDIYNKMGEAGILSAAATINAGVDVDQIGDVPTGCSSPYLVTVTNTTIENKKSDFAGYGATSIDIGAPGTDIYSTLPDNSYGNMTGTSMATPHVAGMIAYLHSVASSSFVSDHKSNPGQAALELKRIIMENVDALPTLKGKTVTGGRINVFNSAEEISSY